MRYIDIFCDGACSGNGTTDAPGGVGVMMWEGDECTLTWARHVSNATNNICELQGAIIASRLAEEEWEKDNDVRITIHTDSAYVHNCFKDKWYIKWIDNGWHTSARKPVANKELWQILIPYFYKPYIQWNKVEGHSTNIRNNMVDSIAVSAKSQEETDVINRKSGV